MIVADSDILIDALRGRQAAVKRIEREIRARNLATTAVNAFELLSGAKTQATRDRLGTLLTPIVILPFDEASGHRAAEIRRALESEGAGIGMADYLIAGICLSRRLPLLTRNRQHFERVTGLEVETI